MAARSKSRTADDLAKMTRLYVEKRQSLTAIARLFNVGASRLSQKLKDEGVAIRSSSWHLPKGSQKRTTCKCGKDVYLRGLCRNHYRFSNHVRRRKCDRRDEVKAMCSKLAAICRDHSEERIGVVAEPTQRKTRYGRNVTYFWQGSHDRSPRRLRVLGYVPERVSLRASRMLLNVLKKGATQ